MGGKPTDLLEVLGEVEPGSFEDVFIFGGQARNSLEKHEKKQTHFVFISVLLFYVIFF